MVKVLGKSPLCFVESFKELIKDNPTLNLSVEFSVKNHFCCICGNEIKNRKQLIIVKVKGFKKLPDGEYKVCKKCVEEKVIKPYGYKDFSEYLKSVWGL